MSGARPAARHNSRHHNADGDGHGRVIRDLRAPPRSRPSSPGTTRRRPSSPCSRRRRTRTTRRTHRCGAMCASRSVSKTRTRCPSGTRRIRRRVPVSASTTPKFQNPPSLSFGLCLCSFSVSLWYVFLSKEAHLSSPFPLVVVSSSRDPKENERADLFLLLCVSLSFSLTRSPLVASLSLVCLSLEGTESSSSALVVVSSSRDPKENERADLFVLLLRLSPDASAHIRTHAHPRSSKSHRLRRIREIFPLHDQGPARGACRRGLAAGWRARVAAPTPSLCAERQPVRAAHRRGHQPRASSRREFAVPLQNLPLRERENDMKRRSTVE